MDLSGDPLSVSRLAVRLIMIFCAEKKYVYFDTGLKSLNDFFLLIGAPEGGMGGPAPASLHH